MTSRPREPRSGLRIALALAWGLIVLASYYYYSRDYYLEKIREFIPMARYS